MIAAIARIGGSVLSGVSSLLSALVKWAAVFAAYSLGKQRERKRNAEEAARVKDDQLEIAARPERGRSDVLERMRRNDL